MQCDTIVVTNGTIHFTSNKWLGVGHVSFDFAANLSLAAAMFLFFLSFTTE